VRRDRWLEKKEAARRSFGAVSKQASNEKGRSLALPGRRHFVETFWRLSLSVYPIPYADVSHISVTRSLE